LAREISRNVPHRTDACRDNFCKPGQIWLNQRSELFRAFLARGIEAYLGGGLLAWPIIVAWIHYVSIMLMIASLLGEHLVLKQELTVAQANTIRRLDIVYGASAAIVLITGILRMFLEKGPAYYNHHIAFHILFGIFVITALISIYPTLVFLRWRSETSAGRGQQLANDQFKKIQMILRVEMTLLLLAPFFATWMAHGEF
jgi:putative membrane protein